MAKPGKKCARCVTPTAATITGSFAYEGTSYEILLCDKHGEMFDRDMLVWTRMAQEAGISVLAERAKALAATKKAAPAPPQPPPQKPVEPVIQRNGHSARALAFGFTYHATERMSEREIDVNDVYALLDNPAIRRVGLSEGTHVYLNDEIAVVVNEEDAKIITVANRRERIEESNGN